VSDTAAFKRARFELLTATWLSYAGFYFCRKVFAVVKSPLKERFALDDFEVSHLWTIFLITYMLGQFLAAWLGRRMESRRVLAIGMAVTAFCNVVIGFLVDSGAASAYVWILVTMAIHGLAQATGWPHNVGLVANWTRRAERGTIFAIWGTCYQLGSIAGKALAAFLFGAMGMAWSFFGSSIVLFVITAIFIWRAQEKPESAGLEPLPEDPVLEKQVDGQSSERLPATVLRMIIAMGLIYFGFKFVRYALDSWSALILREHFKLSTTDAGYLSTAFDWIGFMGVIVGGLASDRLSSSRRAPVIFWMSFGCLLSTIVMWLVGLTSTTAFVVLLGMIGLMAMGPDSLLSGTSAMDVGTRKQAAFAAGVINGVGSIGPIVQESAIGWLKTTSGLDGVFLLLVVVIGLATIGTGLLWWSANRYSLRL
jgi:sugar phosphate permease